MGSLVSPFRKAFSESEHPRGQPANAGQFGPGGAGIKERAGKQRTAHSEASARLRTAQVKPKEAGTHPGAAHGSTVTVKPTKQRAFDGETPVSLKTGLTKQETGRVGEAIVVAYLKAQGFKDAGPMNSSQTNFPIDLIEDHRPTEVKAGLVSNGRKAQQWRLTFSKETKSEKEAYEKMDAGERAEWNAEKQRRIRQRKEKVIKALEKEYGTKVKPRTMTVVVNPDTKTADLFSFDGFHDRIDWRNAKGNYVGSITYAH